MKKYNLSEIMKRAWELVKGLGLCISEALKKAWRDAKNKKTLFKKLEEIAAEKNSHDNGFHYKIEINDWENYGKSRTYLAIVETRDHSKHYVKWDYGYFNNQSGEYVPHKYNKLA